MRIGGAPSTAVVGSATRLVVAVPPHPEGLVDVVVTNADGQRGMLAAGYRYLASPPPVTVTSLSPTIGSTEGKTPLIVRGTGFQSDTIVTLGAVTNERDCLRRIPVYHHRTARGQSGGHHGHDARRPGYHRDSSVHLRAGLRVRLQWGLGRRNRSGVGNAGSVHDRQ